MPAKKRDYGQYYKCGACEVAGLKEEWERVPAGFLGGKDVRICPHCGALIVIDVANIVDDEPEAEEAAVIENIGKQKGGAKK